MTQKTRGHTVLNVCMAFVIIAGVLYLAGGLLNAMAWLVATRSDEAFTSIAGSVLSFSLSLTCFTTTGLIRLAIHVADDLYMLRLLAVNAYSRLPQLPKP